MMWEQLLKEQKWENYYNCECKGGKRSYYQNPAFPKYDVKVNRTKGTFSILHKNHVVGSTDWLYNLKPKLIANEIFITPDPVGAPQE